MKRLAGVTAALVLSVLALAGTADATQPYMERDVQGPVTFAAGELCSFPVHIQPTAPDGLNFFVFSDGEVLGAGHSSGPPPVSTLERPRSTFRAASQSCKTATARSLSSPMAPSSLPGSGPFFTGTASFNSTP